LSNKAEDFWFYPLMACLLIFMFSWVAIFVAFFGSLIAQRPITLIIGLSSLMAWKLMAVLVGSVVSLGLFSNGMSFRASIHESDRQYGTKSLTWSLGFLAATMLAAFLMLGR